jgi:hypothetical protein
LTDLLIALSPLLLTGVLAVIPANIAFSKGRSYAGFWLYGLLFFPVALVHAIIMNRSLAVVTLRVLQP